MNTFLGQLAEDIVKNTIDGQKMLVVVPNQRSRYKLQALLRAQHVESPAVSVVQVDDFFQQASGLELTDPMDLQLLFYSIYSSIKGANAQPFAQFTKWAGMFLTDINEIDLALADIGKLYENISAYKAIDASYQEDREPGQLETQYLSFWKELPQYYTALRTKLKDAGLAYRGMAYRTVAQRLEQGGTQWFLENGRKMTWAGFGVFNPAEISIINYLKKAGICQVRVDSDAYYLDNPAQEAGNFIRNAFGNNRQNIQFVSNGLLENERKIHVYPVAGKVPQVKLARHIAESIPGKDRGECVIVLADESLLEPMSRELLGEPVNITMGMPVRKTAVHRFAMLLMELHAHHSGPRGFYHKQLMQLLMDPLARAFLPNETSYDALRQHVTKRNLSYLKAEDIYQLLPGSEKLHVLLNAPSNLEEAGGWLQHIIDELAQEIGSGKIRVDGLQRNAITDYSNRIKIFFSQVGEILHQSDLKSISTMLHQHIGRARLYLQAPEDKDGKLQVMGMLETRLLDFKHVIMVGANEDNLPAQSQKQSFIPFVHRTHFGLPLKEDTDAMYAYHFYRLLQRTQHVHLIYSTTTDEFSSGEPSRYILQLENELCRQSGKTGLLRHQVGIPLAKAAKPAAIEKSPRVMEAIETYLRKSISPSALNNYVNSPIEFYYYNVLGFREQEVVEDSIQMSSFGTAVHATLEEYYTPFVGKPLDREFLRERKEFVRADLIRHFSENFNPSDLQFGRNHIMLELAAHYVHSFLDYEIAQMKRTGNIPTIMLLEKNLKATLEVDGRTITFGGIADRIDRIGETVRIIDYKTGLVTPTDLTIHTLPELREKPEKSKALQLMLYQWMYSRETGVPVENICPLIYSFRRRKGGFQQLNLKEDENDLDAFLGVLTEIVRELLDPEIPLQHRPQSKYKTIL